MCQHSNNGVVDDFMLSVMHSCSMIIAVYIANACFGNTVFVLVVILYKAHLYFHGLCNQPLFLLIMFIS